MSPITRTRSLVGAIFTIVGIIILVLVPCARPSLREFAMDAMNFVGYPHTPVKLDLPETKIGSTKCGDWLAFGSCEFLEEEEEACLKLTRYPTVIDMHLRAFDLESKATSFSMKASAELVIELQQGDKINRFIYNKPDEKKIYYLDGV